MTSSLCGEKFVNLQLKALTSEKGQNILTENLKAILPITFEE